MTERKALLRLWDGLNACADCRDARFGDGAAHAPARPQRLPHENSILFLGEAPPRRGGFWKPGNGDNVRRLLLPALPMWPEALDWDSQDAIDWFVDQGLFFVQAMKWTLLRQSYGALTTRQRCLALEHAVHAHLDDEVRLISPRAIIALGTGAWDAWTLITERRIGSLIAEPFLTKARRKHYELREAGLRGISAHVTFLPAKRTEERHPERIVEMTADVARFLRCVDGVADCGIANPQGPIRGSQLERREARALVRRLKAVGLLPRPEGWSDEQVMRELERREDDRRAT